MGWLVIWWLVVGWLVGWLVADTLLHLRWWAIYHWAHSQFMFIQYWLSNFLKAKQKGFKCIHCWLVGWWWVGGWLVGGWWLFVWLVCWLVVH
jgi:hypothetical protein